jgi:hypothetical protein
MAEMAGRSGVAGTRSVGNAGIGHQETAVKEPASAMEERLSDVLEPWIVLPAQFYALAPGNRRWGGEQLLMAAVLEDAIALYLKPTSSGTSQARDGLRDARQWLHSEDRSWVFSFLRVCEALDLDPDAIRRRLRSHRRGDTGSAERRRRRWRA